MLPKGGILLTCLLGHPENGYVQFLSLRTVSRCMDKKVVQIYFTPILTVYSIHTAL